MASGPSDDDALYIESFDRPGYVLSSSGPEGDISLLPFSRRGALQRWRRVGPSGNVRLESVDSPGTFLTLEEATQSISWPMIHRSAAASRRWRLRLGEEARAVVIDDNVKPFAEYPKVAFWTAPSRATPSESKSGVRRFARQTYLLFPINEMVDEHYTVYFCKLSYDPFDREPPSFCR